jgi:Tol biopolymer transport system component
VVLVLTVTLAMVVGCGSESTIKPGTDSDAVVWTKLTSFPADRSVVIYPDWLGDSVAFCALDQNPAQQALLRIGFLDMKDPSKATISTYPGPANWIDARPRWLRSGLVVFESTRDLINRQSDLYTRVVQTGQDHRLLATAGGDEHYPAPRPGTPGLVYEEGADLRGRLVIWPDTTTLANRQYLTRSGFPVGEPAWDPTGSKVVFASDSVGVDSHGQPITYRHLWWTAPPDTTSHQLTFGPNQDQSPLFSPDGTKILFASGRGDRSALWIMDPVGGEAAGLKRVAFEDVGATIFTPCWSPDGTRIIVSSDGRGYGRQLWVLSNLDLTLP